MKLLAKLFLCLALIVIISMLVGCGSSSEKAVATIGDYKITAKEFETNFQRKIPYSFPSFEEEYNKRREILDSMIVLRLLIQGAYDKQIDQLDEINRVVIANKNNFLLDVLYNKYIGSKTTSTDAEVQEFYDKQRPIGTPEKRGEFRKVGVGILP